MKCLDDSRPIMRPRVLQHIYQSQQRWIDHAEEDLLAAIYLCREKKQYFPHSTICYLLHQSIEKWLKAFLEINGITMGKTHNLFVLLKRAGEKDEFFSRSLQLLDQNIPIVLEEKFSSDLLRYSNSEELLNTDKIVAMLFPLVFKIRRIVKSRIRQEAIRNEREEE